MLGPIARLLGAKPPAGSPRLPSRRATAALATAMLLAGAGVGAVLPAGRAGVLGASARSALTASLLGAVVADQSTAASPKETPQPTVPSPASEPTASESTPAKETEGEGAPSAGRPEGEQEAEAGAAEAESEASGPQSAGSSTGSGGESQGQASHGPHVPVSPALLSQITHVWVIVLSGGDFEAAVDHRSLAPYLTGRLLPKGTLLTRYALVSGSPLANDIALLSGQGPNPETERGCPTYTTVSPASEGPDGLASGSGCVYPASVQTLADQVSAAALTWRAYVQDMAPTGAAAQTQPASAATCRHPQLGGSEPVSALSPGEDYLVSRNPFVFFDSLIESHACEQDDVDLSQLGADLAAPAQTPGLSWIAPAACDDGSQSACSGSATSGLAGADAFLRGVVPQILATAAYREHGLILLTFDSGPAGTEKTATAARSSHGGDPASAGAPQGARVGALIVSPFVNAGAKSSEAFDAYSLLKSLERLFGVPLLGHAAEKDVTELGAQIYRDTPHTTAGPAARQGRAAGG